MAVHKFALDCGRIMGYHLHSSYLGAETSHKAGIVRGIELEVSRVPADRVVYRQDEVGDIVLRCKVDVSSISLQDDTLFPWFC